MWVTCADGTEIEEWEVGSAKEDLKNIRLEADTTSCDITNVKVSMKGEDAEAWGGHYGAIWKDMNLYVWKEDPEPHYSLLDDTSEWWNISSEPYPVFRDEYVDGFGKEIQFSYEWASVYASTLWHEHDDDDVNFDVQTQLNFDFNVRGDGDDPKDDWIVTVVVLNVYGNTLWSNERSG